MSPAIFGVVTAGGTLCDECRAVGSGFGGCQWAERGAGAGDCASRGALHLQPQRLPRPGLADSVCFLLPSSAEALSLLPRPLRPETCAPYVGAGLRGLGYGSGG